MDEFDDRRTIVDFIFQRLGSERLWPRAPLARPQRWLLKVGCFGWLMALSGLIVKAAPKEDATSAKEASAPASESPPKRVPKKKPVTEASRGGRIYDTEPTPISVSGVAIDDENERIAGAKIYLTVRRFPPSTEVVEGKFQVFGVATGHGFAWHGVRAYRPRPRPAQDAEPEMDRLAVTHHSGDRGRS